MDVLFTKLKIIWGDSALRTRILFVIGALAIFRLGSIIPIPGVDALALERLFASNQFFGLLNLFSGGGLANVSILMLGVGPYITASIIMQLLTMIFPKMKEMYHEEGEAGRKKFSQYSRMLTAPLAMLQGFGLLALLESQGVLANLSGFDRLVNVLVVTGGAFFLMWVGELITEYGVGNGVSLIIFAGIVATMPTTIGQLWATFDPSQIPLYLGFLITSVLIIGGVVVVTEAERPIPVTYAKQVRGNTTYGGASTYLPIRLNQAGVMPIIFALSILLFPQMIAQFLQSVANPTIQSIADQSLVILSNQWVYSAMYFILVVLFTFFYSAVTFEPDNIANNLQKGGAFVPGVRPGTPTSEYLAKVVTRLTLVGALFLGAVALLPLIMQGITGNQTLAIGGTGLLIVVSVVLEFVKQIDAQLAMREY